MSLSSTAIQALRSVLNSFSIVNRKNMFVYQERTTKSVFYLRLCETSQTSRYPDLDGNLHTPPRPLGLVRSQEPVNPEDQMGPRSSIEGSRPVGQVDKHILLLVHGVGNAEKSGSSDLLDRNRRLTDGGSDLRGSGNTSPVRSGPVPMFRLTEPREPSAQSLPLIVNLEASSGLFPSDWLGSKLDPENQSRVLVLIRF
ncbi:PREDICTED: protein SZT2-like [Cyprinodon variegatus]|uniref:protein SZT2-like n=1 Tax=Cyprinodon variegatus TaxID=28743 RepID=UPI000742B990|nr:PREDICTED: protein SZT2-like [Cyprinodon variegatus]